MRIAQIAPLFESVPPRFYGGTERIVHYLTEELVRQGHEVTLFASADSITSARLEPGCANAFRLGTAGDPLANHVVMMERAFRRHAEFDVMHSHLDFLAFPLIRRLPGIPILTTLHGRLDLQELDPLYREFREVGVVSISFSQREPIDRANWLGTVHHGLPPGLYRFHPEPGSYLAFLGRASPEKRLDTAISIAVRAGVPIRIAAKVDRADRDYFAEKIRPLLDHPLVEFMGEIGESEKNAFLGGAMALLFPVDWPEPFGLVMIESMACGTPVIAMRRGSVPEVMSQGVSGFVVGDEDEAVAAVAMVPGLSRAGCRAYFESRFTSGRMAADYQRIYRRLSERKGAGAAADRRKNGGDHSRPGQALHNGRVLPGRKTEPGSETRRNFRHLR